MAYSNLRPFVRKFQAHAAAGRRVEARIIFLLIKSKVKETQEMTDQTNQTNGAKRTTKKTTTTRSAPKAKVTVEPIPLTQAQMCKLWQIIVGGDLVIEQEPETGQLMYLVSLESFSQALPVLLERL